MRKLTLLLPLSFFALQAQSAELSRNDISLMNQIARNCMSMPTLSFPRPSGSIDRGVEDFQNYKRWFFRDMNQLKKNNPSAISSSKRIKGKPFINTARACQEKILDIDAKLTKATAAKPSQRGQQKINDALFSCDLANKWLDNPAQYNAGYEAITDQFQKYTRDLEQAKSIDKKVLSWKAKEIGFCNSTVKDKYTALKSKYDAEQAKMLAAKKAKEEAQKAAIEAERLAAEKRYEADRKEREAQFQRHLATAKSKGYKHYREDILSFVEDVASGRINLNKAPKFLISRNGRDNFKVMSVVGDNVVYGLAKDNFDIVQIAVKKQNNRFYNQGSQLPYGYYALEDIKEFTTVVGATVQILVLEEVAK